MIGYRDGAPLTTCDDCYRPKRTGEAGWVRRPRPMAYRSPDQVDKGRDSSETVDTAVDLCPECLTGGSP